MFIRLYSINIYQFFFCLFWGGSGMIIFHFVQNVVSALFLISTIFTEILQHRKFLSLLWKNCFDSSVHYANLTWNEPLHLKSILCGILTLWANPWLVKLYTFSAIYFTLITKCMDFKFQLNIFDQYIFPKSNILKISTYLNLIWGS